jgi:probable rRNA maturation factor
VNGKQKRGITVSNRQRLLRVHLTALAEFAERALIQCLKLPARKSTVLAGLSEVNVVLLSDRRMAAIHRRFLNETGPTDVITFQHGEIFVSVETAKRQARRFGTSLDQELRLYIAHGLLHLHGFDDKTTSRVAEMERVQEQLVATVDRALRRSSPKNRGAAA